MLCPLHYCLLHRTPRGCSHHMAIQAPPHHHKYCLWYWSLLIDQRVDPRSACRSLEWGHQYIRFTVVRWDPSIHSAPFWWLWRGGDIHGNDGNGIVLTMGMGMVLIMARVREVRM